MHRGTEGFSGRATVITVAVVLGLVLFLYHKATVDKARLDGLMQAAAAAEQARVTAEKEAALHAPKFVPVRVPLASGSYPLASRDMKEFEIVFDADTMRNVAVVGRFSASGGNGNDIEAYIFNDDDYTNWKNNHSIFHSSVTRPLYSSGTATVGNVGVKIPTPGKYHLVFYNDAMLFPKTVKADIALQFDKLKANQ